MEHKMSNLLVALALISRTAVDRLISNESFGIDHKSEK